MYIYASGPSALFVRNITNVRRLNSLGRKNSIFCHKTSAFFVIKLQNQRNMKKGLHPDKYRLVIFKDMSNGHSFLSRSTADSKEKAAWEDGNEYPVIKLEISNMSHPFFTGKNMMVDTAGRIDKFNKRYEKRDK